MSDQFKNNEGFNTPILFIIFNRPAETEKVFNEIKKIRPSKLFISADGPRTNKENDKTLCEQTRKIVEKIDWPCSVEKLFQEQNLGCKLNVSKAITWFFQNVSEGIILEDDCLPNKSFFYFSEKMLNLYRNEEKVMAINGTSMLSPEEIKSSTLPYHFSRCLHVWGWATWKRAWDKYDIDMKNLDSLNSIPTSASIFNNKKFLDFWVKHFKHIRDKNIDTWDAQWHYTILSNDGLVISPHVNMIENIGFGPNATHTLTENTHKLAFQEMNNIDNIGKYESIIVDTESDLKLMKKVYLKNIWQKIISRIKI